MIDCLKNICDFVFFYHVQDMMDFWIRIIAVGLVVIWTIAGVSAYLYDKIKGKNKK